MNKTLKPLVVIVVAIAIAAGAAMFLSREDAASSQAEAAAAASQSSVTNASLPTQDPNVLPPRPAGAPAGRVRGPENAPVTLVEFGDYQCPSCGGFHPIVKELLKREGNNLKFEFHHFPLIQIHRNALAASRAAEAAGDQGRYWEMNDVLFVNQSRWSEMPNPEAEFLNYANRLGLDGNKFLQSYRSPEVEARVLADVQVGRAAQIDATPTFFVNGQRLWELPQGVEDFQKTIQSKMPAAK